MISYLFPYTKLCYFIFFTIFLSLASASANVSGLELIYTIEAYWALLTSARVFSGLGRPRLSPTGSKTLCRLLHNFTVLFNPFNVCLMADAKLDLVSFFGFLALVFVDAIQHFFMHSIMNYRSQVHSFFLSNLYFLFAPMT